MFSALRGNIFMIVFLIYSLACNIIISLLGSKGVFVNMNGLDIQFIYQLMVFVGFFTIYISIINRPIKEVIAIKRISFANIIFIIVLAILINPIGSFLNSLLSYFLPASRVSEALPELMQGVSYNSFVFTIAVVPAILEEIAFRGIFAAEYKNSSPAKLIAMTGIFFGLMHLDPVQSGYATLLGVFMGGLLVETGSIFAPMLAHFVINATGASLMYLVYFIKDNTDKIIEMVLEVNPTFDTTLITDAFLEVDTVQASDVLMKEAYLSNIKMFGMVMIVVIPIFFIIYKIFKDYNESKQNSYFLNKENLKDKVTLEAINGQEDYDKYFEGNVEQIETKEKNMKLEIITFIIIIIVFLAILYLFR